MPDATLLDLTAQSFTRDQLAIKVKNISGVALDKSFMIEMTLPRELVLDKIRLAADKASTIYPPMVNVDAYVKGTEGKFTAWAEGESTSNFVTLMFVNDTDKDGAAITPIILAADAVFTILISLDPTTHHTNINLPYGYQYDENPRVSGNLELKAGETDWTPKVTFTTNQASPTAITPMDDVKIQWEIEDGVSAVLRGPLPGGNTEWALSDNTSSSFKMSKGSFVIKAVDSMTFMLQAEVKGPNSPPNVRVARMLSLDIATSKKYGYISARPARVLPLGLVELDWAAWGVKAVRITAPGTDRNFKLTDMTLSGFPQGSGVARNRPRETETETSITANLFIEIEGQMQKAGETSFMVVPWTKMKRKPVFTGNPIGLAVNAPKMALLTTEGLWIAEVGRFDEDEGINDLKFKKVDTDTPRAWLATAALGDTFVVLRQKDQNDPQVAFYKLDGTGAGILPLDLKPLMGSGPIFDFVVYRNRAYVVVESSSSTGRVRSAFSVGVVSSTDSSGVTTRKAEYRNELLLESLSGYRLLTFDDALFALNRDSGQMFRLELKDGKLELYKAASAAGQQGASMVQQGLLVPCGRVLAVLNPTAVPSLASLAGYGLRNVLPYTNLLTAPQDDGASPQDLVYDAQHNRWARCGHGADIKKGVVAFREGESPRLWAIDPDKDAYTLTGSTEDLFLADYDSRRPSDGLPPVLNQKRTIKIINNTDMRFVPLNDLCFRVFLTAFSATRPVDMTPAQINLTPRVEQTFDLRYNQADPGTTTLRFLLQRPNGIPHEYFLEVTISGADLSTATSVFKRLTMMGDITEVPGTRQQHSTAARIDINPQPLVEGIRLKITNDTPYRLWLRSPDSETEYKGEEIHINYSTAKHSIYAHGAGELSLEVDFTLPPGIEVTTGNVRQTTRLRVDSTNSQGLRVQLSYNFGPNSFHVVYKFERPLSGVYLGDGVPSKDGEYFYLPLANASVPPSSDLLRVRANDLQLFRSTFHRDGNAVFSAPNGVAVLRDRVLAVFKDIIFDKFNHELRYDGREPWDLGFDVVTNFKGSPNDDKAFILGMKQESSNPPKYSYKYLAVSGSTLEEMSLDALKGFGPARVPGAPAWVAPNTISPMDVSGGQVAICVNGGLFLIQVRTKTVTEIKIDGTGREEAVLMDPVDPVIYCAHSRPDGQALMISRIDSPTSKKTTTLSSPLVNMLTDTRAPVISDLRYNCPRAVRLAVQNDWLFVSHGSKIYVLDKMRLNGRKIVFLDLPCRLIQVRGGKPPGENHPKYGAPQACYFVWAIGSTYEGDGQSRNKYQTLLYKIAVVL